MRERVALVGGSLDVDQTDRDFRVRVRLPYGGLGMSAAPVRVLLVDDDDLMRAGLRAVLSSDDTVTVVGKAPTAAAASISSVRPSRMSS